jgi:D-aspartate ligase
VTGKKDMEVALILGGYVNGYSIIRELSECGVKNIWLFHDGNSPASKSNRILDHTKIENTSHSLREHINELHKKFDYIVIYPTHDNHLDMLSPIFEQISSFCFIPFNVANIHWTQQKSFQYETCKRFGIPSPRSTSIIEPGDISRIQELEYPLLIKPDTRLDLTTNVFRNLFIKNSDELTVRKPLLIAHLKDGIPLLASECIPGDDTNIYSYSGYRSKKKEILNEWIGKKLTQFPDRFGQFSSATNVAPEIVKEQGRQLLEHLDIIGFGQPEFKFDRRDKKYKLMEVNLRSMMWNRVGCLSGVHLHYTQWCDAIGIKHAIEKQDLNSCVHFVYMKHEICNLLSRRHYWKHFLYNLTRGDKTEFAFLDKSDPWPFLYDLTSMPKVLAKVWLTQRLNLPHSASISKLARQKLLRLRSGN